MCDDTKTASTEPKADSEDAEVMSKNRRRHARRILVVNPEDIDELKAYNPSPHECEIELDRWMRNRW